MSLFRDQRFPCPDCGSDVAFLVADSLNADRRPDLRAAILDGSYQGGVCDMCGCAFRVAPRLTYLDIGRGQWILALPADQLTGWAQAEAHARALFDKSFGAGAPPAARAIGAAVSARLTFGWAGLREKLLCRQHGVDDAVLEALKAALLRAGAASNLSDEGELRLVSADDDGLDLSWLIADGFVDTALRVPMGLCTEIGDDPAWRTMIDDLRDSLFVDMNRILVPA